MLTLSLSNNYVPRIISPDSHQSRAFCRLSPKLLQLRQQQPFTGLCYNPLRELVMAKRGRRFGAVCYSSPLAPRNLQWISAVSTGILMIARGTAIQKSFLVPLFALQAPGSIITWMKGEYGMWTAFLALLVRLFFHIPGELELPFITFLLVIVAPHQIMRLRGTQEGVILSLIIAAYLAFLHFIRAGSLAKSVEQGSILATIATICIVLVPCLLLI
ncbi:cold-regulated 413 inner membrane protein 1, chloroplastic-like [Salvia miltiorrhiza]|uniref:cold-regulated 413 inner membrane protein 1, chloroplastic-like n=1 Tax=Salvia miltiorrhiza TaxID=226208 RepID=UPI0025ACD9F3|nr:cold-regulated 413 inner membrane protein 1, chloroplastic-like [Salvia miltiorrhiza]